MESGCYGGIIEPARSIPQKTGLLTENRWYPGCKRLWGGYAYICESSDRI